MLKEHGIAVDEATGKQNSKHEGHDHAQHDIRAHQHPAEEKVKTEAELEHEHRVIGGFKS